MAALVMVLTVPSGSSIATTSKRQKQLVNPVATVPLLRRQVPFPTLKCFCCLSEGALNPRSSLGGALTQAF